MAPEAGRGRGNALDSIGPLVLVEALSSDAEVDDGLKQDGPE